MLINQPAVHRWEILRAEQSARSRGKWAQLFAYCVAEVINWLKVKAANTAGQQPSHVRSRPGRLSSHFNFLLQTEEPLFDKSAEPHETRPTYKYSTSFEAITFDLCPHYFALCLKSLEPHRTQVPASTPTFDPPPPDRQNSGRHPNRERLFPVA